jgi:altronate dehydratase
MSTATNDPRLLCLAPDDNINAVKRTIEAGEVILIAGQPIRVTQRIPTGHKIAVVAIARGEKVRKYGDPIGIATQDIRPGEYVHTHNVASDYLPTYTLDGLNPYLKGN